MTSRRHFNALGLALLAGASHAQPQPYPARPIRLIVPFAAGASYDYVGRAIGARLGEELHQPVVVDNVTGAAGAVGTAAVARAANDGYTIGLTGMSAFTLPGPLGKSVPYDPVKNFTPIGLVVKNLICIAVRSDFPATTLRELADYARQHPEKVSYGTPGVGTSSQLEGEMFNHVAGIRMVHVGYRGAAPQLSDLLSGQVPVGVFSVASVAPHVRSGQIRMLALLDDKRAPQYPDVPTRSQAYPGYDLDLSQWMGLVGPAGLPASVVQTLNTALNKVLRDPGLQEGLDANGMVATGGSSDAFARQIGKEIKTLTSAVRTSGVKAE